MLITMERAHGGPWLAAQYTPDSVHTGDHRQHFTEWAEAMMRGIDVPPDHLVVDEFGGQKTMTLVRVVETQTSVTYSSDADVN